MTTENPFGEVIYRYTDTQAQDDGILVALNGRDRMTRTVFDYFVKHVPDGPKPPGGWPVEIMGWFKRSKNDPVRDAFNRAVALAKGLVGGYGAEARRIYDENIGGGVFKLAVLLANDKLSGLTAGAAANEGTLLWLMPNELGGMTLMFPEDY